MPKAPRKHQPLRVNAPRHNPRGQEATNRQRTRAMHTGSKAWRQLRAWVLARDGYTCVDCGRYGDQVDHDDGDSHNNDPDNLKTRCIKDHSAKTMRELNKAKR